MFPFTVGLCVGEVVAWFLGAVSIMLLVFVLGAVWMVSAWRSGGLIVGFVVGAVLGGWECASHPPPVSGSDVEMLVHVEDSPRRRVPGEVVFLGREILGFDRRIIRGRAVDVPWRGLSALERGDVVWIRGMVTPLVRPLNPFSWDGWLWRRGVSGEMKVLFGSRPLQRSSSRLHDVRRWMADAVTTATGESRGGALFLSMAFGFRDVLSPPVESLFSNVGLSHLLVVSGYQVSLVFGFALTLFLGAGRRFRASLGTRRLAIGAALASATAYVFTIGSEMSSVRALLAAVCLCMSLLMHRPHRFAQRLVVTFLCMNLLWPWALFEIGVVLTFAALAGIGIGSTLGGRSRLNSLVCVTISAWLLTSIVTIVWNGTYSVSGLMLNLILAAPWSVLNCTVGVGGLVLLITGVPGADIPVRVVSFINEEIVSALFWLQTVAGSPRELSLHERVATAVVLCATCTVLARRTIRSLHGVSQRSMVRGGRNRSAPGHDKLVNFSGFAS